MNEQERKQCWYNACKMYEVEVVKNYNRIEIVNFDEEHAYEFAVLGLKIFNMPIVESFLTESEINVIQHDWKNIITALTYFAAKAGVPHE